MSETLIYASSNGDQWVLVGVEDEAPDLVEHRPNVASGGRISRLTVDAFLADSHPGPEHLALRYLLATPVAEDEQHVAAKVRAADVEIRQLALEEEIPADEDHVLVLHSLSGEHRIVMRIDGMAQVSGRAGVALPSEEFFDTPTRAIERARALAAEHGIRTVYVREDPQVIP
ncbi:MAG: hypothetical protein JWM36_1578 [Hyphomicrobiales bacterium]|nr:hypothetical protein [Hyphomicrobiales bacterium]